MSFLDRFRRPTVTPEIVARALADWETRSGPTATEVREGLEARLRAAQPQALVVRHGARPATVAAMDSFDMAKVTVITDVGAANVPDILFSWFGAQTFIGHQMCAILAQHWLIDKACSMPARDAIRNGFDLVLSDVGDKGDKVKEAIAKADKDYALNIHMQDYVRKGRVFGIRLALFKVDLGSDAANARYYANPFNPDAVSKGSYKGMVQIDPYWVSPQMDAAAVQDPTSDGFYEPTWWLINGRRYHKSHFCIFRTSPPADILKPSYLYGGIPLPQRIMERVYAAERTANEGPQLAMSKRLMVWKTNLAHLLARQDKFMAHMANETMFRDNFGQRIIDEDDEMAQFDTTLAGFDDLMMGQYEIVCAIAEVPSTKLLGTTPKGFNSTGGYEESSYHEHLETLEENDLTPLVDRHHLMVARSEIEPKFGLSAGSLEINIEWEPLDSPDGKEQAEINYVDAQTADLWASMGAIDGQDARDHLRTTKNSGYGTLSKPAPEPEPDADPALGTARPNPGKALAIKTSPDAVS